MTMESCATLAALHNRTSQAQLAKLLETLRDFETDARTLASEKN